MRCKQSAKEATQHAVEVLSGIAPKLIETTESFPGCGKTSREKKVFDKNGKKITIKVEIFGFKVGVMVCAATMILIAVKVEQIQVSDY